MKKLSKKKTISIKLPSDVIEFYRKVAKFSGTTLSQTILVITGAYVIKTLGKK